MKNIICLVLMSVCLMFSASVLSATERLVFHNTKIMQINGDGSGRMFFRVQAQSREREEAFFWAMKPHSDTDVITDAWMQSHTQKTFDIYYYTDFDQSWAGITWSRAYAIGYRDRQYDIELGRRIR